MHTIKSAIQRRLNARGLELKSRGRTIWELESCPRTPTSGWVLEFIGTRGVGKSTLENAVYAHLKDRWFFRHNLRYTGPTETRPKDIERLHRRIFLQKIDRMRTHEKDAWACITNSRQMAVVAYESLMISSNRFPKGFILNDGLFKNFANEILEVDSQEAAPLWRKRAFVYLRARDPHSAVTRFQKRAAERRERGLFQRPQTDEEVRSRVEADNATFDRVVEQARAHGCPTTTVYAESDFRDAMRSTLDFERSVARPAPDEGQSQKWTDLWRAFVR